MYTKSIKTEADVGRKGKVKIRGESPALFKKSKRNCFSVGQEAVYSAGKGSSDPVKHCDSVIVGEKGLLPVVILKAMPGTEGSHG